MPFASVANTSVPSTVPTIEPRPPASEVPPIDDGGHGVELEQVALGAGRDAVDARGEHDAGDRGEHADEHVDAERRCA